MDGQRRFQLHRGTDVTGVSGTGVVAEGAVFDEPFTVDLPTGRRLTLPPGWVLLTWRGPHSSTVLWRSLDDAMAVHGHNGATQLVWNADQTR